MRIAVVSTMRRSAWGGSEELWCQTAQLALERGHDVLAAIEQYPRDPRRPKLEKLSEAGATVVEHGIIPFQPARWRHVLQLRHPRLAYRVLPPRNVFEPVLDFRPDVVLFSSAANYCLAERPHYECLVRELIDRNIPYFIVAHGGIESFVPPDHYVQVLRFIFANAAGVAQVSERNAEVLQRQLAWKIPRLSIIRNPVNMDGTDAVRWPIHDSPARFATVSRLDLEVKGFDLLLEALATDIWQARDWQLDIHGGGRDRDRIRQLIDYYNLADHVTLAGHAEDIRLLWAQHHLLILSSRTEAAPLAIVEAMLCARPVVATDVGGVSEWVLPGQTGFLAPAPDPRYLSHALDQAWQHRHQWPALGQAARQHALARLQTDPVPRLLDTLEQLLPQRAKA